MNTAAFLDIDGTLYRNSLMIEHFKKMVKYEVIDPSLWHTSLKDTFVEWRKRVGEYEDYMLELVEVYYEALKGRKAQDLEFISNQVIHLNGDIVYKYTRNRILWHKAQGHKVFFISGSPDFLVSKMASKYDIDGYRGTGYILDEDGHFTGEVAPMWDSVNKDKAIDGFTKAFHIDLSKSYAYGDTNGDLSMLKKVGNPIAINPAKELIQSIQSDPDLAARATIIIERKDVIYKLDSDVTLLEESDIGE